MIIVSPEIVVDMQSQQPVTYFINNGFHIPPFADKPNEGDTYENYPKAGRTARMEMYRATGARFFLAGHTHRFIAHGWKDLTILNPETTSTNFDSRPHGFRLFDIPDKYGYSYNFVKVC